MCTGYAYDRTKLLLVAVRDEAEQVESEYEEFYRFELALVKDALGSPLQPACIVTSAPCTPPPNAHWRRKYAELHELSQGRLLVALVSIDTEHRGVMTAIEWRIAQEGRMATATSFQTFEGAAAWLEARRGESLPLLPRLRDAAKADLERRQLKPEAAG